MSDDPSPWTLLNEYTQTVVTLAAGVLAFTATFSGQFFHDAGSPTLLFASWALLVLAIAAALFSAARLNGFLRHVRPDADQALTSANVAYFALFLAILVFFVFAFQATRHREPNDDSTRAVTTSRQYLTRMDTSLVRDTRLGTVAWNGAAQAWDVTFVGPRDTVSMTVDPATQRVTRFHH